MAKDYLKIVLNGWELHNSGTPLAKYFKRQMIIAESEFYDNEEFLDGCLTIIKAFENNLENLLFKEKRGFYLALSQYKSLQSEKIEIAGKMVDRLIHIEYVKNHIASLSVNNFSIHLLSMTNGAFWGHLWSAEIETIKYAIISVYEIVKDKPETPQPINENKSKPIDKTGYQKSLRQWYLEKYENEPTLQGREIGIKLNQASCEGFLNAIRKFYDINKKHNCLKKGVKNDFQKVKESLKNYPNALKAIKNDIDFNLN